MAKHFSKGISPLIASVLLIAFTVSLGTLILGWMGSLTQTSTDTIKNKTADAIECSSATIQIQDVYITPGATGSVRAIISNSGFTDNLVLTSAQVYTNLGNNYTSLSVPIADFDRGEVISIFFNNTDIPSCTANFSKVIVATSCGGTTPPFEGTPKCTA